jgi:photosystem II stability/assembly factor-like uncharacterized protein
MRLWQLALLAVALLIAALTLLLSARNPSPAISWRLLNNGLRTHARVFALAVSPLDPQAVLAAVSDDAGVYLSEDGARHWRPWNEGLLPGTVYTLRYAPDGQSILAGTQSGVYTRAAGGASWSRLGDWPSGARVYGLAFAGDGRLFAAADEAGVLTWDGAHWQAVADERLLPALAIAVNPADPRTLAVGTGGRGLYISRDGGESWEASGAPLPFGDALVAAVAFQPDGRALFARPVGGLYRSDDGGRTWAEERGPVGFDKVSAIVFDSQHVIVAVGEEGAGVLARELSGTQWQRIVQGLHPRASALALAIAPGRPQTLYLGADNQGTGGGVWRSDDGGQSWTFASDGLGAPLVYDLAIDAADEQTVYAATWDGIYASQDGGAAWLLASNGLDAHRAFSVAVGPRGSTRVYAGSNGGGVYVSDRAQHWQNSNSIDETGISQVVVDPRDERIAYAKVIFDRLYKTTDGGQIWHSIWNGIEDSQELVSAAIDPRNPDRLFAGASDGLYLTETAGAQWKRVGGLLDGQTVFALAADPTRLGTWFAGATRGLYRSEDNGLSWNPAGLTDVTVSSLAFDSHGRLFIGTKYHGLLVKDNQTIAPAGWPAPGASINAIRIATSGVIYVATPLGVYRGERP